MRRIASAKTGNIPNAPPRLPELQPVLRRQLGASSTSTSLLPSQDPALWTTPASTTMSKVPVLYQETKLSLNPTFPSSVLHINAAGNTSNGVFGAGRKRPFEEISGRDEESFARKNLATEGSVFFRPRSRSPRSFLWRVLNDQHLLEVQCVDLVVDKHHARSEGWLTFHIAFPTSIIPNGVALADAGTRDALDIFVLTTGHDLYTITLKSSLLALQTPPTDFDSTTCVKKFAPGTFSFRHPYRLWAASSQELFVSLHDGGLMRLERQANESGAHWRETFFSEGGWSGTLKGLIPFARAQTVRYAGLELDANAIAGVAKSPDGKYVWTVGLDHTLKAWSIKTGKIALEADLLNEKVDKDERRRHAPYVMSAEQGTLLQIVVPSSSASNDWSVARLKDDGKYSLVVHSPKDHQFKFYSISTNFSTVVEESLSLIDIQPGSKLVPPIDDLMNTNIWHLERFFVSPGPMWQQTELYLRARSGALCRTFTIHFDLLDETGNPSDLDDLWRNAWSVVDSTALSIEQLRALPEFSGLDSAANTACTPSEKWLDFLFFPGRFSEDALESALYTYRKAIGLPATSSHRIGAPEQPLKERLTTSIAAKVVMGRLPNDRPDYDRYRLALQREWHTFFSILSDLHKRRHESLNLAFDPELCVAWTVCADFVAPIRMSSSFELLCLNSDLVITDGLDHVDDLLASRIIRNDEEDITRSQVIAVAQQFRHYFSEAAKAKLTEAAVLNSIAPIEDQSPTEAMQLMYEACDLHEEVSDDEFNAINEIAEQFGGLGSLSVDNFLMVIEMLEENMDGRGKDSGLELGRYGAKMTVAIAQQTLQQTYGVLLDVLALVVFMTGDLEPTELHPDFRPEEIFDAIMLRLRHLLLRLWLMSNMRQTVQRSYNDQQSQDAGLITRSLYEAMFIGDWDSHLGKRYQETPELLTFWSKRWAYGLDLSRQWDDVTGQMMANLLLLENFDLAQDFVKFLSDGPWSYYLKARLHIATGDYAVASLEFKQAAEDMARLANPGAFRSNQLLSAEDLTYFGSGTARYFQHVLSLFEKIKVYSYTAEFSSLALAHLETNYDLNRSIVELDQKKSQLNSPAAEQIDNTMEEIRILKLKESRDDILTRLFYALNQTGRFPEAYDALLNIANPKLQIASLQTLLQSCVKQDAVSVLLQLPITGDLAQEADQALLQLAKRSLASGPASGPPYHRILFAYRAQRSDFRGAAAILYEHLARLRHSRRLALLDPDDDSLIHVYVLLINTLACCDDGKQGIGGGAWLLADPIPGVNGGGAKRSLVTLDDIRAEYAAELDRRSDVMQGRFPVAGGGDEMDVL